MSCWDQPFSDPIALSKGDELHRLRDAGAYIIRLPNSVYRTVPWRVAIHLLIQAAEYDVPVELARISVIQALYPCDAAARVPETV
ncbi:MAG: hypothetical protein JWR49_1324 [Tardiphaga sp.]|nr:hypothetical protein [Tardiphaga sp.]